MEVHAHGVERRGGRAEDALGVNPAAERDRAKGRGHALQGEGGRGADGDGASIGERDRVGTERGDGALEVHEVDLDLGHGLGRGRGQHQVDVLTDRQGGEGRGGLVVEVGGRRRGRVGDRRVAIAADRDRVGAERGDDALNMADYVCVVTVMVSRMMSVVGITRRGDARSS